MTLMHTHIHTHTHTHTHTHAHTHAHAHTHTHTYTHTYIHTHTHTHMHMHTHIHTQLIHTSFLRVSTSLMIDFSFLSNLSPLPCGSYIIIHIQNNMADYCYHDNISGGSTTIITSQVTHPQHCIIVSIISWGDLQPMCWTLMFSSF